MARTDLLALSPDSLAALTNRGLVKRAQKELGRGAVPAISEDAAGVVVGCFQGDPPVVTTLPPGVGLQDTDCSCGARGKCRHRVALVLAYQAQAPDAAPQAATWSPGAIEDAALEAALGAPVLQAAKERIGGGMVVELLRSETPSARLPTCTVRFLVPADIAYARCDCALGGGCEHVAVAVWAFRDGDQRGSDTAQLGGQGEDGPDLSALDAAEGLVRELLLEGAAKASDSLAQRFATARAGVQAQRLTWIEDLLDDLEGALADYRARSARYREERTSRLLAELAARARAARSQSGADALPPRYLLGAGEARETPLDHIRLVSLGARVDGDASSRGASVWLADPDTATVLVLSKRWSFEGKPPPEIESLRRRTLSARVPLGTLATGQLVTRVARRHANRRLSLGSRSGIRSTSLSPQHGDLGALPPPVLVHDLSALVERFRDRPPRSLRPRIATEDFHVVALSQVAPPRYVSGEQAVVTTALDTAGNALRLIRRYRSVTPGALAALAAALSAEPRFVSGRIERGPDGLVMAPVAVVCASGMVVPDLAPPAPTERGALGGRPAERGLIEVQESPLQAALRGASAQLDAGAHQGLRALSGGWPGRVEAAAGELAALGLRGMADRLRALAARTRGLEADPEAAAAAWLDAAIRVQLALELR